MPDEHGKEETAVQQKDKETPAASAAKHKPKKEVQSKYLEKVNLNFVIL